jgi:hypothetical protein
MKKTAIPTIILLFILSSLSAQKPIDVLDMTIKLKGKKELFYGFEKGDEIILNLEEKDGKEIKEIQVLRYPNDLKYSNFKTASIKDKKITVEAKGVYKFVFANSKGRLCQIKIQRIPASEETIDFNTGIEWMEKADTTFKIKTQNVITGYNTYDVQKSRKVLDSKTYEVVEILNTKEQVHSQTYLNGPNVNWVNFQLPKATYYPNQINPYKVTKTVSWAYAIATEGNGMRWYQKANTEALASEGGKTAVAAGYIGGSYAAVGLLALKGYSTFANPPSGENIKYQLITVRNGQNYTITHGDCVLVSKRYTTDYLKGAYAFRLENDNMMNGINVIVTIYAVQEITSYKNENYTVQKTDAIKEKKILYIPKDINIKRTPVNAE